MEKRALAVRKHVRLEGCIGDSGVLETGDYCQRQTAEGSRRNSRFKEQPSLRNSRVFAFDQRPRQVAGARNERGRTVSVPNFTFLSTSSAGRSCDRVTFSSCSVHRWLLPSNWCKLFSLRIFFSSFSFERIGCSGSIIYYNNFCCQTLHLSWLRVILLFLFWHFFEG